MGGDHLWEEVGAIGQVLGSIAVFITLIYVAIQIGYVKRQVLLASYQHNVDKNAEFVSHVAASEPLAEIITRGRTSYAALDEQLRWSYLYPAAVRELVAKNIDGVLARP